MMLVIFFREKRGLFLNFSKNLTSDKIVSYTSVSYNAHCVYDVKHMKNFQLNIFFEFPDYDLKQTS